MPTHLAPKKSYILYAVRIFSPQSVSDLLRNRPHPPRAKPAVVGVVAKYLSAQTIQHPLTYPRYVNGRRCQITRSSTKPWENVYVAEEAMDWSSISKSSRGYFLYNSITKMKLKKKVKTIQEAPRPKKRCKTMIISWHHKLL